MIRWLSFVPLGRQFDLFVGPLFDRARVAATAKGGDDDRG